MFSRSTVLLSAFLAVPATAIAQPTEPAEPASGEVVQPEPMPEPDPEPVVESVTAAATGYKSGFFIESPDGKFKIAIQGRVQGRFELDNEQVTDAMGESSRETGTAFSIARARLTLKGHAFTKNVKYKFQTDFGKGNVTLKDLFIDYKMGTPIVRVGQFKRPFSRQQITAGKSLSTAPSPTKPSARVAISALPFTTTSKSRQSSSGLLDSLMVRATSRSLTQRWTR